MGGGSGLTVMEMEDIDRMDGAGRDVVVRVPLFVPEASLDDVKSRLRALIGEGFSRFMLPTYGWIDFFREYADIELFGGPMLYMVNSFAWRFMMSRGLKGFSVSPDMASKASTVSYRGYITPQGFPQELMATRLRLPGGTFRVGKMKLRVRRFRDYDAVYGNDI
jgi:hypothetical protein